MSFCVAKSAEPSHIKRLGIVFVVALRVCRIAVLTRLAYYRAVLNRILEPSSCFDFLVIRSRRPYLFPAKMFSATVRIARDLPAAFRISFIARLAVCLPTFLTPVLQAIPGGVVLVELRLGFLGATLGAKLHGLRRQEGKAAVPAVRGRRAAEADRCSG